MASSDDSTVPDPISFPSKGECVYTSHYCEENIWKLCDIVKERNEFSKCYVVFVSNDAKITPLWCQSAGTGVENFVVWDYHVFLVYSNDGDSYVYDFDSLLGFPCKFSTYMEQSIRTEEDMLPKYKRYFRVVSGKEFLNTFASDRSHMKRADGSWLRPPPTYDPITSQASSNNIMEFISMSPTEGIGKVMEFDELLTFFKCPPVARIPSCPSMDS